ncbi:nuclear transport factor 2 family protein [Aliagarivorans marinus]|uniref:nuclear transport factor 2 family protein n=1 Tax=Aliagarivorans marinus TaxID=561965 RepID=UPI000421E088|nr:hypothetical protein [Aliagarivorans marinus]
MSKKLENATALYMEGIRDGHAREAVTKYTGRRYTQHSTGVRNGIEGFVEFFGPFLERCPVRDIRIVRGFVDQQYVFVQAFQDINNGEAKWVTTDLFDTDSDDKIIEHWDVIAAFDGSEQSEPNQISGPIEADDLAATEDNKETVRTFMCDVMVLGDGEQYLQYVDGANLIEHKAADVDGFEHYIGSYDMVFKLIGQGNMVVAYSQLTYQGQPLARFDIFRLSEGKIVELWANQEPIPPKDEWTNGGKF